MSFEILDLGFVWDLVYGFFLDFGILSLFGSIGISNQLNTAAIA
jgi:hypothetical protein